MTRLLANTTGMASTIMPNGYCLVIDYWFIRSPGMRAHENDTSEMEAIEEGRAKDDWLMCARLLVFAFAHVRASDFF